MEILIGILGLCFLSYIKQQDRKRVNEWHKEQERKYGR